MPDKMKRVFLCVIGLWIVTLTVFAFTGSGTGIASDPYLITNADQLFEVRNNLNASYRLMADIDMSEWLNENSPNEGWSPIGSESAPFSGIFDGNNHAILHLYINRQTDNVGFIGVSADAYIYNISFIDLNVRGQNNVGGVVGYNDMWQAGLTVQNVSIISSRIEGNNCVGGIVGLMYVPYDDTHEKGYTYHSRDCTINNCYCNADIVGNQECGGICGATNGEYNIGLWSHLFHAIIIDNVFDGVVKGETFAGGIIGHIRDMDGEHYVGSGTYAGSHSDNGNYTTVERNIARGNIVCTGSAAGIVGQYEYDIMIYSRTGAADNQSSITNNVACQDTIVGTSAYRICNYDFDSNYAKADMVHVYNGIPQLFPQGMVNGTSCGQSILYKKTTYEGLGFDFESKWKINEGDNYPFHTYQSDFPNNILFYIGKHGTLSGTYACDGTIYAQFHNQLYIVPVINNQWSIELGRVAEGDKVRIFAICDSLQPSYTKVLSAEYDPTPRPYQISFFNWDSTLLCSSLVDYGQLPIPPDNFPTKPATPQYTYTFAKWIPEMQEVRCETEYIAAYDSVLNNYQVTFLNYNLDTLQSSSVSYGEMPEYTNDVPIRPSNKDNQYAFKCWSPTLDTVYANQVYVAEYDTIPVINYSLRYWFDSDIAHAVSDEMVSGSRLLDAGKLQDGLHTLYYQVLGINSRNEHLAYPVRAASFLRFSRKHVHRASIARYWFDNDIPNAKTDTVLNGVRWVDASSLGEGIHTINYQLLDTADHSFGVYTTVFYRRMPQIPFSMSGIRLWYDQDIEHAETISQWHESIQLNVNGLRDGMHIIHSQIVAEDGRLTQPHSAAFVKLTNTFSPHGNPITSYSYWEDDHTDNMQTVRLENLQDTLVVSSLDMPMVPIRNQSFAFGIENEEPMMYARPMLHCRFTDARQHVVEDSATFIDYRSKKKVVDIDYLLAEQNIDQPQLDELRWFKFHALADDTIRIWANSEYLNLTLYSPSAELIASGQYLNDICLKEDGMYYMVATKGSSWKKGTKIFFEYHVGADKFLVDFCNYDGEILQSSFWRYGTMPEYTGNTPYRPSDDKYSYIFSGWNPELVPVTIGPVMYIATYTQVDRLYRIVFQNPDESEVSVQWLNYGQMPEIPETAYREPTSQYSYIFQGWYPEVTSVTKDMYYTAKYDSIINQYPILFINYNGDTLLTKTVSYGELPTYTGSTPFRPSDDEYSYIFRGWFPELTVVTGECTYTAQYERVDRMYRIQFLNPDGSEIDLQWLYAGDVPICPENPQMSPTAKYSFIFIRWEPEVVPVTSDATYTAQYDSVVNQYMVRFIDYDKTVLQSSIMEYGTMPAYVGTNPSRSNTAAYTYVFNGWTPELGPVTQNVDYIAGYDSLVNRYTLDVITPYGYSTGAGTYDYGTKVEVSVTLLDHYHLEMWMDGNTDNPRWVSMTENICLEAWVAYDEFTVSAYDDNDGQRGWVDGSGRYEYGTFATLVAYPKSGYRFSQWSDQTDSNPYVIYVEKDINLAAMFVADSDDEDSTPQAYAIGHCLHIEQITEDYTVYSVHGTRIYHGNESMITLPTDGVYIVVTSTNVIRIMVQSL